MNRSQIEALLSKEENLEFIQKNLQKDTHPLLLKYAEDSEKRKLIEQIAQRQRVRKKLPSFYQNPKLYLAPSLNLGQSSSEETAQLKANWIGSGSTICDLSAGFGIDFLAFIPRFEKGLYNEPNASLAEIAAYNLECLGQSNVEYYAEPAESLIESIEAVDLIYLDPSRKDENQKGLIRIEDCLPNLIELLPALKARCNRLLVKLSPMLSLQEYLGKLEDLSEVWVISQRNECKEICFYWNFKGPSELKVKTIDLGQSQSFQFDFNWPDSQDCPLTEVLDFLYIPNASIMKSSGQNELAAAFHLTKLDVKSHIYTSKIEHRNFPGRVFKTIKVDKAYSPYFKKKALNVISRNFYDKADKVAHKLKIKRSSKTEYLIATQVLGKPFFIHAEQLL